MKVYKYVLWESLNEVDDFALVKMPAGARVLHVDIQGAKLCVWALVNPAAPMRERSFRIAGTGHEIDAQDPVYIGTFYIHALVFHVFEMRRAAP